MDTTEKFVKTIRNKFRKLTCWHKSLLFLAIFLLFAIINRKITPIAQEGFTQSKKYIEKNGNEVFDDFYVALYDSLYYSTAKDNFEILTIKNNTNLSKKSKILDVGSGTGNLVGYLSKKDYDVTGIDISSAMVKESKKKYPNADFQKKDALVTMSFPSNTFTHVTCTFFTIYYIENKQRFFSNCIEWLKPGGFLILHLVDREQFDPVVPASDPLLVVSPQKYVDKRITNSYVKFKDCEYKANFSMKKSKNLGKFTEKIKSDKDGHIRQNNHKLFMPTQKSILNQAKDVGFILQQKIEMKQCQYDNQFIYILTKPN